MFWKNAQARFKHYWLLSHPRRLPITLRLAGIYTVCAFGLLALISIALYWIFADRLEQAHQQFLQNKIVILQNILQTQPASSSLREEVLLEPPLYHYYSRLIDATGHIIIETAGMSTRVPVNAFARLVVSEANHLPTAYWTWHRPKDKHLKARHYLLVMAKVESIHSTAPRFIQMALDITAERRMLAEYRRDLIIMLLIGIVGSAVIGFSVTHKALKPLREITRSTELITVARLKDRLDPTAWPWELSSLASAFNHMLDRIEDGFTRLSQFSADLAHELRTPITNLKGEAEIALSRLRTTEEYRQVLESSLEEFARLAHIIESLLFLARAENPQAVLTCTAIEVNQVLKDIADFYEALAEEKNVKINYQGAGIVYADSSMLRRALSNLVANALRHTPPGGTIMLATQVDNVQQVIQISVNDSGEGIAAEHLPHLFDRFYRIDNARSHSAGGTGLGLAIVKSIMELHRGEITITSHVGQGTIITLIFPIRKY